MIQTNKVFKQRSCAGCGKLFCETADEVWQADHFGYTSSDSVNGAVLVWHCVDCDPEETRIAFLKDELLKLQKDFYGFSGSDEWKFVQGR